MFLMNGTFSFFSMCNKMCLMYVVYWKMRAYFKKNSFIINKPSPFIAFFLWRWSSSFYELGKYPKNVTYEREKYCTITNKLTILQLFPRLPFFSLILIILPFWILTVNSLIVSFNLRFNFIKEHCILLFKNIIHKKRYVLLFLIKTYNK